MKNTKIIRKTYDELFRDLNKTIKAVEIIIINGVTYNVGDIVKKDAIEELDLTTAKAKTMTYICEPLRKGLKIDGFIDLTKL